MAEKREHRPDGASGGSGTRGSNRSEGSAKRAERVAAERHMPAVDEKASRGEPSLDRSPPWQEPREVEKGIADADKAARTGSTEEPVRNTPPAGAWNDTSGN